LSFIVAMIRRYAAPRRGRPECPAGPHTAGPWTPRAKMSRRICFCYSGFRKVESERDIGQVGVLFQRHFVAWTLILFSRTCAQRHDMLEHDHRAASLHLARSIARLISLPPG